jgi:hypothetical protein
MLKFLSANKLNYALNCTYQTSKEILTEPTLIYVFSCVRLAISQCVGAIQPTGYTVTVTASRHKAELGGQ